jgi:hypothetical protein
VSAIFAVYIVGVVVGLIVMRDPWPARIIAALAWPLGVVAFAVVAGILSLAAVYLWPVPVLATAVVIATIWIVF